MLRLTLRSLAAKKFRLIGTALAIVIGVGFYAIASGGGDLSRITVFTSPEEKGLFLAVTTATSIAFFAMVGFEDSAIARHMDPALTSVRQPTEEMGRTMARVLLEEIAERSAVRRHVVLATELVQRDSV